jgi:uncharacterized membrane protein YfcA
MEVGDGLAILGAGLGAGVVVTAIGAGSLVSFPILLATGLSPLVANVCNNVGLVPGGLSGTWGYRRELAGKRRLGWAVAATSALGALLGAWILLAAPASAFEQVVPWLVILAATLVAVQPLVSSWMLRRTRRRGGLPASRGEDLPRALGVLATVIGVYGGYFGAGQGVMLVAFLAFGLDEDLQTVNGLKNIAILSANLAATAVFLVAAPLDWAVIGLLALGSVVGGWLGAHLGRRLHPTVFRVLVVATGYLVGVHLLLSGS